MMGYFDDIKTSPIPAFAPRQQRKPNILDRVLGLYGSDPNTHIPEGQRGEALRRGLRGAASSLTQAGLQGVPMSPFERLNVGFEGMAGTGAAMAQEQKKKQLEALLMGGTPADLQMAFRQALAMGDTETAQILGQQLSAQMRAKEAGAGSQPKGQVTQKMMEDGQYHNVLLDMVSGNVVQDLGPVAPDAGVVVDRYNPDTGVTEKVLVDRKTGELISKVGETAPKAPGQYESEAASRLSQFRLARQNIVEGLERTGRGPNWAEWNLYNRNLPGRQAISSEMQGLLQAQNLIVTQIAKELGGVRGAASPSFRDVIARTYLIAPGDQPLNIEQTLEALEAMERDLERKAGKIYEMEQSEIEGYIEGDGEDLDPIGEDIAPEPEPLLGRWPGDE